MMVTFVKNVEHPPSSTIVLMVTFVKNIEHPPSSTIACKVRDRQIGATRMLVFDRYQNEIMTNTFTYTALPSSIA